MPNQAKKYALMYIPHRGLFWDVDSGRFTDADRQEIAWNGALPVYVSREAAVAARDRILAEKAALYAFGTIIVMGVEVQEKADVPQN